MNYKRSFFLVIALFLLALALPANAAQQGSAVKVIVFHQPQCHACLKLIHIVLPPLQRKYGDKISLEFLDINDKKNYEIYLQLEKDLGKPLGTPTVVVGRRVIIGLAENVNGLDKVIEEELRSGQECPVPGTRGVSILEHFKSFGPLAVIGAGLVDGVNPCAFTVIIFFISFLTIMGYKRREMLLIGSAYIAAVFFTYLVIGLGLFRAFYCLNVFYWLSKALYVLVGALSVFLGVLALRDFSLYKKTGSAEGIALQLPAVIKKKIHDIVSRYYRQPSKDMKRAIGGLIVSALVVGFLISLLEAVCTGQLYLPTIVMVLKEGTLRSRAIFYLLLYNLMFILPLVAVLVLAFLGATSKDFEHFVKKHLGFIKLAMAAVFLALGAALLLGLF